jgi:hypothetical protein
MSTVEEHPLGWVRIQQGVTGSALADRTVPRRGDRRLAAPVSARCYLLRGYNYHLSIDYLMERGQATQSYRTRDGLRILGELGGAGVVGGPDEVGRNGLGFCYHARVGYKPSSLPIWRYLGLKGKHRDGTPIDRVDTLSNVASVVALYAWTFLEDKHHPLACVAHGDCREALERGLPAVARECARESLTRLRDQSGGGISRGRVPVVEATPAERLYLVGHVDLTETSDFVSIRSRYYREDPRQKDGPTIMQAPNGFSP